MEFQLLSAPVETVHIELLRRNLDLLITRQVGAMEDERLDFQFLFHDSLVVVAGTGHPCARRRKIVLSQLSDELWVLPPPEYVLGTNVREVFRANGIDRPRVTVATISPDIRMSLVATGRYLTILPASALTF